MGTGLLIEPATKKKKTQAEGKEDSAKQEQRVPSENIQTGFMGGQRRSGSYQRHEPRFSKKRQPDAKGLTVGKKVWPIRDSH